MTSGAICSLGIGIRSVFATFTATSAEPGHKAAYSSDLLYKDLVWNYALEK